jgi:photosystem II PsbT protein
MFKLFSLKRDRIETRGRVKKLGWEKPMESAAYILIFALAIGTIFFAIAFREPPRVKK